MGRLSALRLVGAEVVFDDLVNFLPERVGVALGATVFPFDPTVAILKIRISGDDELAREVGFGTQHRDPRRQVVRQRVVHVDHDSRHGHRPIHRRPNDRLHLAQLVAAVEVGKQLARDRRRDRDGAADRFRVGLLVDAEHFRQGALR